MSMYMIHLDYARTLENRITIWTFFTVGRQNKHWNKLAIIVGINQSMPWTTGVTESWIGILRSLAAATHDSFSPLFFGVFSGRGRRRSSHVVARKNAGRVGGVGLRR
jgi:hypothetical protein